MFLGLREAMREVEEQYHACKFDLGIGNLEEPPGPKGPDWRHSVVKLDQTIEKLSSVVKHLEDQKEGVKQ